MVRIFDNNVELTKSESDTLTDYMIGDIVIAEEYVNVLINMAYILGRKNIIDTEINEIVTKSKRGRPKGSKNGSKSLKKYTKSGVV